MASLRNWVTGSDACAPSDSMGGNNAASSFADALLGGRSKRQQRLHELPSVVGQERAQEAPEDAAAALAETPLPAIPGAIPGMPQVSVSHPSDFERAWAESSFGHTRPPVSANVGVTAVLHSFLRPDGDNRLVGSPLLRSTMEIPEKVLSVPEGLRVRNRSTILARHVYADRGAMYADQQVEALLRALHIDASSLPHTLSDVDVESWNRIYNSKSVEYPHNLVGFASENTLGHPSLINNNKESWADEFAQAASQTGQDAVGGWANEYLAKEVEQGFDAQPIEVGTQEHSRKLANTLNKDPKFQNSKFLQFVSKMSNGELIVEGNAVKEVSKTAAAWVEEFSNANSNSNSKPSMWGEEFASFQAQQHPAAWVDEFANTGADWGNEYLEQLDLLRNSLGGGDNLRGNSHEYVFAENNPFLLDMDSMEKGKDLFQRGVLTEAVLAFEAACQQNPGSAEAWRLLGTVHAENDDDVKAIVALNRSLAIAPDDLNTLLSLGVSHTNELEREPAVRYLKQWVLSHPTHGPLLSGPLGTLETLDTSADSSQSLNSVVRLFETAASQSPSEPEVHSALGVLYTLSRRFSDAVTAFEAALEIRGSVDYSLWNKLGATLANSGRSAEALAAYQRALDLKPNYMRAWTNMGIALANLGEYENSARYYVRALALNRSAPSVWGYLRNSLSCAGRDDLMRAADEEDLDALLIELPL